MRRRRYDDAVTEHLSKPNITARRRLENATPRVALRRRIGLCYPFRRKLTVRRRGAHVAAF
jgi:hypothetical protein